MVEQVMEDTGRSGEMIENENRSIVKAVVKVQDKSLSSILRVTAASGSVRIIQPLARLPERHSGKINMLIASFKTFRHHYYF